MSALAHRRGWRGPARLALLVVGVLAAVLVAALLILGHTGSGPAPRVSERVVGQPAPNAMSTAPHTLTPAAADAARSFLAGYLAYQYGQGESGQIRDASPQVLASLTPGRLTVNPGALKLHPAVVVLGASEAGGSVLHVMAQVSDGITRYPIRIVLTHEARGWAVTQLPNPE